MTRKRLGTNVALAAGAVAIYAAGLQQYLLLRHYESSPASQASWTSVDISKATRVSADQVLGWDLVPNAGNVINAEGFLGPVPTIPKPTGTYRIAVIGDSIAFAFGETGQSFVDYAQAMLNTGSTKGRFELLNFGVGGYDTTQEVRRLEVLGLKYQPDVVVLQYCINDGIDFTFSVQAEFGTLSFAPKIGRDDPGVMGFLQRSLRTGERMSSEAFFARVFEQPDWKKSMAALGSLAALAKEHRFKVVVMIFPVMIDWSHYVFGPYHERVAQAATTLGMDVLDLFPLLSATGTAESLKAPGNDVIHLTPDAQPKIGQMLAQHLMRLPEVAEALP